MDKSYLVGGRWSSNKRLNAGQPSSLRPYSKRALRAELYAVSNPSVSDERGNFLRAGRACVRTERGLPARGFRPPNFLDLHFDACAYTTFY